MVRVRLRVPPLQVFVQLYVLGPLRNHAVNGAGVLVTWVHVEECRACFASGCYPIDETIMRMHPDAEPTVFGAGGAARDGARVCADAPATVHLFGRVRWLGNFAWLRAAKDAILVLAAGIYAVDRARAHVALLTDPPTVLSGLPKVGVAAVVVAVLIEVCAGCASAPVAHNVTGRYRCII